MYWKITEHYAGQLGQKLGKAKVDHNVSQLYYKLLPKRNLRNVDGPVGRIRKIQKTVTALVKYERIELNYQRADECRGYAERLISEAIRRGPEDREMMELANFWLLEKQLVHKLFKVLVPRLQDYPYTYTKMYKAPIVEAMQKAVLEIRGNIYPDINVKNPPEKLLLHNMLLNEARKEFRMKKYQEIAESLSNTPIAE